YAAVFEVSAVNTGTLPQDLQRQLDLEQEEIAEAVLAYGKSGGWPRGTPTQLPWDGTDEAVKRYVLAKQRQTKLDLLTSAMLLSGSRRATKNKDKHQGHTKDKPRTKAKKDKPRTNQGQRPRTKTKDKPMTNQGRNKDKPKTKTKDKPRTKTKDKPRTKNKDKPRTKAKCKPWT
ncbi:unnamed protein product, partial [Polarella glacialis]